MKDFFSEQEFLNCNPACKKSDMEPNFMERLNECRAVAGVPFRLTSAYRTVEYEKSRGRSGNSAHTVRCAVDIAATDSRTRFKIIAAAIECGFTRIGVAKTFVHLDTSADPRHAQEVFWLY
jgi:uncharacterized protein YcbK (DUF882 family)